MFWSLISGGGGRGWGVVVKKYYHVSMPNYISDTGDRDTGEGVQPEVDVRGAQHGIALATFSCINYRASP